MSDCNMNFLQLKETERSTFDPEKNFDFQHAEATVLNSHVLLQCLMNFILLSLDT